MKNILHKTYSLHHDLLLNREVLSQYISRFWDEVFSPLNKKGNTHLMLLCRVSFVELVEGTNHKTLGPLRKVEFKDKELFIEYLSDRLNILTDTYSDTEVTAICFTYVVKKGPVPDNDRLLLKQDVRISEDGGADGGVVFMSYSRTILPVSMDPKDYGTVRGEVKVSEDTVRYFIKDNLKNRTYEMDVNTVKGVNNVTIMSAAETNWVDTKIDEITFKREINKTTYYFLDREIVLVKKDYGRFIPFIHFRQKRST